MSKEDKNKLSVVSKLKRIDNEDTEDDEPRYEYEVSLVNKETGETIDHWNSLTECYRGSGHLTKENAESTIENIKADVKQGNADAWFDI